MSYRHYDVKSEDQGWRVFFAYKKSPIKFHKNARETKSWVEIIIFLFLIMIFHFCQNDTYAKWTNEVFEVSNWISSDTKYDADLSKNL